MVCCFFNADFDVTILYSACLVFNCEFSLAICDLSSELEAFSSATVFFVILWDAFETRKSEEMVVMRAMVRSLRVVCFFINSIAREARRSDESRRSK